MLRTIFAFCIFAWAYTQKLWEGVGEDTPPLLNTTPTYPL